ncbi:MAG: response regulator [Bacteroidetes bacterium]|jgi:DNA-binding NarL/FixJ family response regulator|nr:response regulator [Bacteroidota bacterium]
MTYSIYILRPASSHGSCCVPIINQWTDATVCGVGAATVEELEAVRDAAPDLVLVDIGAEGMTGIEFVKPLAEQVPVLVVAPDDEPIYVDRALQAGARGYLTRAEAEQLLPAAIQRILDGHVYLSDRLSMRVLLQHSPHQTQASPLQHLSDRELEVFEHLGRGCTTQQIADALCISPKTVESHRGRIKHKLAVGTSAELRRRAAQWVRAHRLSNA